MRYDEDDQRNRKWMVAAIMGFLLIFVIASSVVAMFAIDRPRHDHKKCKVPASKKAINSNCQPTGNQQQSVKKLQTEAGNTTDPKEPIRAALQVAMKHVTEAAKTSTTLKEVEKNPRATLALQGCKDLMDEAIEDLRRSFDEIGKSGVSKIGPTADNLKTWISATITYQETCLDGFENTTSEAGEQMRKALKTSMELSINAIAMVNKMSSLLASSDNKSANTGTHRRLHENNNQVKVPVPGHGDLYPSWLDSGNRRLLI